MAHHLWWESTYFQPASLLKLLALDTKCLRQVRESTVACQSLSFPFCQVLSTGRVVWTFCGRQTHLQKHCGGQAGRGCLKSRLFPCHSREGGNPPVAAQGHRYPPTLASHGYFILWDSLGMPAPPNQTNSGPPKRTPDQVRGKRRVGLFLCCFDVLAGLGPCRRRGL